MSGKRPSITVSALRIITCVVCPPIAIADRGCKLTALVGVLTLLGWLPGVVAALLIYLLVPSRRRHYVTVPMHEAGDDTEYFRLADGTVAEVVDDGECLDDDIAERLRRKADDPSDEIYK